MLKTLRMALARWIYPEIFVAADFWKNRINTDFIGYENLSHLKADWEQ